MERLPPPVTAMSFRSSLSKSSARSSPAPGLSWIPDWTKEMAGAARATTAQRAAARSGAAKRARRYLRQNTADGPFLKHETCGTAASTERTYPEEEGRRAHRTLGI